MSENPFPGMNPWLEFHWSDVHTRLTTYACDQLQPHLPAGLHARIEEYVAVEIGDASEASRPRYVPDVRIVETPERHPAPGNSEKSSIAVAEPLVVPRQTEPETLHYIQIVDSKAGHRVVTTIEFLSPANKTGEEGRQQYHAKQQNMLNGGVNLVEVDLLRAGAWVLAVPKACVPDSHREPYRVCVVRADRQSMAEVYRISLADPLPAIRIPLRPDDADVPLQLQPLIDLAYVNGRYDADIDYGEEPQPPLTGTDAIWVDQWLRNKQLR